MVDMLKCERCGRKPVRTWRGKSGVAVCARCVLEENPSAKFEWQGYEVDALSAQAPLRGR